MDRAFALAHEALAAKEVPIGCVLVHAETGDELGAGRNRTNESGNVGGSALIPPITLHSISTYPITYDYIISHHITSHPETGHAPRGDGSDRLGGPTTFGVDATTVRAVRHRGTVRHVRGRTQGVTGACRLLWLWE